MYYILFLTNLQMCGALDNVIYVLIINSLAIVNELNPFLIIEWGGRLYDLGAHGVGSKAWVLTIGVLLNPERDSIRARCALFSRVLVIDQTCSLPRLRWMSSITFAGTSTTPAWDSASSPMRLASSDPIRYTCSHWAGMNTNVIFYLSGYLLVERQLIYLIGKPTFR